ncbi:hypothetical protein HYALB_00000753 [Hymenoscyphus albidus]|uniref:Uncharacterized protein n=1 Tax=Hymenoscyphus albidus TaxID=595503 RepID=A0A9N9LV53_9HELO|nr:hypothetical protein HYALB_00000753 [Hymenoscyphus albidus]
MIARSQNPLKPGECIFTFTRRTSTRKPDATTTILQEHTNIQPQCSIRASLEKSTTFSERRLNYGKIVVASVLDEKGRNVEYMLAQAYSLEGDDMEPPIVSNENGGEQAHVELCPSQHPIIPNVAITPSCKSSICSKQPQANVSQDTADQIEPSAQPPHKNQKYCFRQMLALKAGYDATTRCTVASGPRTSLAISEDELCKVSSYPLCKAHPRYQTQQKARRHNEYECHLSQAPHLPSTWTSPITGHKLIPLLSRLSSLQHEKTSYIYKSIHDEKYKNMNIYSHKIQLRLPATSVKIG